MWNIFQYSISQYLLWETCCKNCTYKGGTFLRKEVKLLSVQHNLKFKRVKMSVLETHLKIFSSCFLYIQYVVTRNKFASFRAWKLDTLTLLTVKENLNTNLLRTIISSLVNKNYYYAVILFLCLFSILPPSVLYFPCYVEAFLDSKLELNFSRKKKLRRFFKEYCVRWTNVIYS